MTNDAKTSREKARQVVLAALERKAERPVALDVSELTSFAEAFVIVGGRSDRQVRALADERVALERVLAQTNWNRKRAAQRLAVSYKTLLQKIKETGLGGS